MQAAVTELSGTESGLLRRHWITLAALLVLAGMLLLVILDDDLRALAADTWREMLGISPLFLALIFALKVAQTFFSAITWRNALLAAWPRANLPYRFVLGIDQGQDALNTVAPARAGTWAMLGIFAVSIPGARAPKLLAVWAVQSLAFGFFSLLTYAVVAIGLPERAQEGGGMTDRVSTFASERPLLSAGIAGVLVVLLIIGVVKGHRSIRQTGQQIREGLAILGSPTRYVRLLFLPSLAAFLLRIATCVAMLAAFGIPVTVWTVALALGARSVAGAVRFTPGGIGTTQAIDVIALRDYAAPEVVTAYSLADFAISTIVSFAVAIIALFSLYGWHGTIRIIRRQKSPLLLAHRKQAVHGGKPSVD